MNALLILMTCLSADVVFDPAEADALLTEPKSETVQGKRLSEQKLYDDARVRFREGARTDEERAAAEYNVGRTLTLEAATLKLEGSPGDPKEVQAEMEKRYDLAAETFERAYGMSQDKSFQAESALAAGNARLSQGDLKKAVENYRRSMVAKSNPRARDNLGRALRAMRAQPPPPPEEEKKEGEEGEEGEDSDEKSEGETSEDDKESEDKDSKGEEQKPDGDEKEEEKDPKAGEDDKDEEEKKDEGDKKDEANKKDEADKKDKEGKGSDAEKPESQSKKDAREMLDALRSKERPIGPMEMRDQKARKRPRSGKDW